MTPPRPAATTRLRAALRHWPVLAALAFAALTAYDLTTGIDMAQIVAASAVVYLGAAALARPSTAWPVFFLTVAVITAAKFTGADGTWPLLAVGLLFAIYAILRRRDITRQGLAMIAFGAAALLALLIDETLGSYLVALALFAHTAWDIHHYRTNRVVSRSMSEFCMVLDTLLALAILTLQVTG